jgi:hypothetical protein
MYKYCLQVSSYKHDDSEKFCGNMQIMLRTENLYTLLTKVFQHENKIIIIQFSIIYVLSQQL